MKRPPNQSGFVIARLAFVFPLVAGLWVLSAHALDRAGAIDVAKAQVKGRCTQETPCNFDAKVHEGNWHVRVEFTKPGGHAIFVINQSGKVVGRMQGK